jgi:hypothetical protein
LRIVCEPLSIAGLAPAGEVRVVVSEEITSHLDGLDLDVRNDYYNSFNRADQVTHRASADEYLFGSDVKWQDKTLLCPEMPIPRHLASAVRLAAPAKTSWTKQAVGLIHAGRAGSMAPVHFDWDHKWIAHACLLGRKRLFIFPPHAGWLLSPVINTSALCIPRFPESDRRQLLNKLGGVEVSLEAGQGVLLPSLFWHGVLYEEPSLSISIRFEPYPGGRPFAVLPRSWLLQRLVWRFFRRGYGTQADKFLTECLQSFFLREGGWKGKYRRLDSLYRRTLLECGEQRGAETLVAENFSAELILASRELKLYYGNSPSVRLSKGDGRVREAAEYIFEADGRPLGASEYRLAAHALRVRQGLPPKRGFVEIRTEEEN